MNGHEGASIKITGTVQGVGFRPFVYALATRLSLSGWVRNTSAGVEIEVFGDHASLLEFNESLTSKAPPLAVIQGIQSRSIEPNGASGFEILPSAFRPGESLPLSADVAVCDDCLAELFDPQDRRYHYPFINCSNCGPRDTIISDLPYDRPLTSMSDFPMCPICAREYGDPGDRRFHAQPIACPVCGL